MSKPPDGIDAVCFQMSGTELVLLGGVTLLAGTWSFERPSARAQLAPDKRDWALETHDQLSRIWKRILEGKGLYVSAVRPVTREFIAKRAAIREEIGLTREHLRLCTWALRLCHEEFVVNWRDFCVFAPGYVDWYGIAPPDLLTLAEKLESLLAVSLRASPSPPA
jgi:hypothetical protein